MLTIQRAKTLQGKLELPPSADLFCVAAFSALALRQPARIHPVIHSPLFRSYKDLLAGHALVTCEDDACIIAPLPQSDAAAAEFIFANDALPHRDLVVFMALGTLKPVVFKSVTIARLEAWREQAKRIGFTLNLVERSGYRGLALCAPPSDQPMPATIGENDINAALALLCGLRAKRSFQVDFAPSTPLRPLAQALGKPLQVKRDQGGVEKDPIIRRMRLQAGQRLSSQDQIFTITADFSTQAAEGREGIVDLLLPGDEVLLGLFIAAKALIHKGSLVIDNAPLDSWALPMFSLLRKMGCKPSQQETTQTAFGAAGMLSLQKFELTGQKTECTPLSQYVPQLPAMILLTLFAEGQSIFRGLEDLRYSEPDGVRELENCLSLLNVKYGDMPDGIVIQGGSDYDGFDCALPLPAGISGAMAIAGLCTMGGTTINDEKIIERWPGFADLLKTLFEYRA